METECMSTDDERRAAEKAQEILSSLTPTTPHSDQILIALGHAAGIATEGSMNVPSEAMVNYVRAATALRAVFLQLEQKKVNQGMIERAKQAVEAWLKELQ
jgi:hypothetical protein